MRVANVRGFRKVLEEEFSKVYFKIRTNGFSVSHINQSLQLPLLRQRLDNSLQSNIIASMHSFMVYLNLFPIITSTNPISDTHNNINKNKPIIPYHHIILIPAHVATPFPYGKHTRRQIYRSCSIRRVQYFLRDMCTPSVPNHIPLLFTTGGDNA